jgi:hypothetical protein
MLNKTDKAILRELAAQVAEIAALPVQEETRALWRKLNALQSTRPLVMIDQVCWNEMTLGDELTLRCATPNVAATRSSFAVFSLPVATLSGG